MTAAWRVCRAPYADLLGKGAQQFGGRWNSPGLAMVYMAEHPALAVLEVRVHLDLPPDLLPDDYVLVHVGLGGLVPQALAAVPADCRAYGDDWLRSKSSALLQVPSVIVPAASNLLLNPAHPDAVDAEIMDVQPFRFDGRLWQS